MTDLSRELAQYDKDLRRIVTTARKLVKSDVPLAAGVGRRHIFGGKRLRAVVALTCGRLCGLPDKVSDKIAAAIEIIHTATLLHDDVVDNAPLRRRQSTVNRVHGNAAAVLVGDFLYSRSSQILSDIGSLPLLAWIARSTNSLAEGEVLQLEQSGGALDENMYFDIIRRKTANLFESAAVSAALVAENDTYISALSGYGHHLGMAFQMIDDCLDYEGEVKETGKKIGADFAEGKMTLPAILALKKTTPAVRRRILNGWKNNNADDFIAVLQLVQETGALEETRRRAAAHAKSAVESLTPCKSSAARQTLVRLAKASVSRQS